ncbi:MAG: phosphate ABC transporter permease subunit PstC [Hyphomicrobiaceae bacterium]|nr:phosphate ABC transporter permease subunit PstC [Hyphomicrobiaceae bacterium]
MSAIYFVTLAVLLVAAYLVGRGRARGLANAGGASLHSLPAYHGLLPMAAVLVVMLAIYIVGTNAVARYAESGALALLGPDVATDPLKRSAGLREILNVASGAHSGDQSPALKAAAEYYRTSASLGGWIVYGAGLGVALLAAVFLISRISPTFRARNQFERFALFVMGICATVAILTTIGIVASVLFETFRFFFDPALKGRPSVTEFLFGTEWNPQAALRADQGDIKTAFGFIPLLTGTLLITAIAIAVAGPLGLFSAIYLSEYAGPTFRAWAKPILEILAGIPTVVLGFFAALTVAPLIRGWGEHYGLDVASESALAAGLVMGMMIIPFISSLSDDVINSVPQSLRDGAYALGATRSETIRNVVLPAALPGIVSAFMLAISRAIGETMIVVMAAGLAANLTFNPLDAVTTITVQIKTILVGDQEFDSAKTLAAFALGFVLFFVTLVLNIIALQVVRRYREQYD